MSTLPEHIPAERIVDVDIYAIPGQQKDYHAAWAKLQADNPEVVWTPQNEGHWIALSGEALAEVQSDHTRFSNRVIVLPKSVGEHHKLIPTTIDPPEHRPYRKLLNANLTPSAIRGLENSIQKVTESLIDEFVDQGYCNFTEQYAEVFPVRIFLALVDLPESDSARIRYWAHCMTRPNMDMSFEDARAAFYDYLDPTIRERRENPGDDMISLMLNADVNGGKLTHEEALSLTTQVLIAGVDTVVNFLGFAMLELARNRGLRRNMVADPECILPSVHELFRRFGLVTIAREVREDINFHGVDLKAGEMIAIPTVVHGIDPSVNPDPMNIDLSRKRSRHSAFGSGPHMCPGQELARREVAITIEHWLRHIPEFEVAEDSDLTVTSGIVPSISKLCLAWPGQRAEIAGAQS